MLKKISASNFCLHESRICLIILNKMSTTTSTHIDPEEESFFKKQSSSWWDSNGSMKPLHSMNKVRVPFIRDGLVNAGVIRKELIDTPKPLKDLSILDVGCGGGILSEPLARLGAQVTGLDATNDLIEIAKDHAAVNKNLNNLHYMEGTTSCHVEKYKETYDAVVLSEVVEHVSEKCEFLKACIGCLKPHGSIFITTISKTNLSWIGAIVLAEQVLKIIPTSTHHWDKFIKPTELQSLLEELNCKTRLIHGLIYNPITNMWSWTSRTDINYALHAIKLPSN